MQCNMFHGRGVFVPMLPPYLRVGGGHGQWQVCDEAVCRCGGAGGAHGALAVLRGEGGDEVEALGRVWGHARWLVHAE